MLHLFIIFYFPLSYVYFKFIWMQHINAYAQHINAYAHNLLQKYWITFKVVFNLN